MGDVGRYRIHRLIAQGGMAEVFEATADGERGFERRVAIKRMLGTHDDDPAFGRMFLDEARIASQLHHSGIVAVLDYGVADGRPFQALELVDGMDARALTRMARAAGSPMPVELALHVCAEIAHALEYAHDAIDGAGAAMEIVHRDVTPANILISWNGDVKLTDFGIAKAIDREEKTQVGVTKGKLSYMSPEQATAGRVDARSDLFSLGCTLYALLRGHSPLKDPDAMTQLFGDGELDLDDTLPDAVRRIVMKATRRDPSARYQTAEELSADLGEAAAPLFETTPRSALREWLDEVRPSSSVRKAAKLDALLDVELVLAADSDGVRKFESTGVETLAATPVVEAAESGPRWAWLLLALVAIGAGAIAFAVSESGTSESREAVAESEPVEVSARTQPTETSVPAPSESPEVPTEAVMESSAMIAMVTSMRVSMRRATESMRTSMTESMMSDPVVETGVGVLRIGGAGAHRAAIFVDGRARGYAPKRLELSFGSHEVELRRDDGTSVTRSFDLGPRHTRTSPESWIVP